MMNRRAWLKTVSMAAAAAGLVSTAVAQDGFLYKDKGSFVKVKENKGGTRVMVKGTDATVPLDSLNQTATGSGDQSLSTDPRLRIKVKDGSLNLPISSTIQQTDANATGTVNQNASISTDLSGARVQVKDGSVNMPVTSTIDQSISGSGSLDASQTGAISTNVSGMDVRLKNGTFSMPVDGSVSQNISASGSSLNVNATQSGTVDQSVSGVASGTNGNVSVPVDSSVTQNVQATGSSDGETDVNAQQNGSADASADVNSTVNPGTTSTSGSTSVQQGTSVGTQP
jgi:hypothetical protein